MLLTIVIATYNRLSWLRRALAAISTGTRCTHAVVIVDGGSTDGTVDFLQRADGITPVFQGALVGTARAYNAVWKEITAKYTCWLSDDTEIIPGSLDLAVGILEADSTIGMVGLKMKDTVGPYAHLPYLGGVSEYGILNCNHGVLPMDLLSAVGYFNESYRGYTIDADLTASILCAGWRVVLTQQVAVLHHREWSEHQDPQVRYRAYTAGIDNAAIYRQKFQFLEASTSLFVRLRGRLLDLERVVFWGAGPDSVRFGLNRRDWYNLALTRFTSFADPLMHRRHPYHWVQRIPHWLLEHRGNPYLHLVTDRAIRTSAA